VSYLIWILKKKLLGFGEEVLKGLALHGFAITCVGGAAQKESVSAGAREV
jgi:hypothetical protein